MQGLEQRKNLKSLIAKVNRDFKPANTSWYDDGIEWIYEGLAEIGTGVNLINKTKDFEVHHHRCAVPCDMQLHHRVIHNCKDLPNINIGKLRDFNNSTSQSYGHDYYYVEGGYFKFSFEVGTVRIIYDGIDVDCDGFPTIPDSVEFFTALSWFIVYHLLLQGNTFPNISIDIADREWNKYKRRARNIATMPSPVEYEKVMYYFNNVNLNLEMLRM